MQSRDNRAKKQERLKMEPNLPKLTRKKVDLKKIIFLEQYVDSNRPFIQSHLALLNKDNQISSDTLAA